MKKICYILVVLFVCIFSGCVERNVKELHKEQLNITDIGTFRYIEYDGHKYLLWMNNVYQGGITHSPDCPCLKNNN